MRITAITMRPYRIPFRRPFVTAHGVLLAREGAIVTITTDEGISGHGDMAAVPEFAGPLLPELLAATHDAARVLVDQNFLFALAHVHDGVMNGTILGPVCFALETAIYDCMGRRSGQSIAQVELPEPSNEVSVNFVIGEPSLAGAIAAAQRAMADGFGCVKLKVGVASDLDAEYQRIAAVRAALGPTINLRLDANEAWSLNEATAILTRCADLAIQYVEQPLHRTNVTGMRFLRRRVAVPIAADEAVSDLASIFPLLAAGAADILVLKPQMLGGWFACQLAATAAVQFRKRIVMTSALESGIGVVATLHLAAAMPLLTLACGLATLDLLEDDLLFAGLPIVHGAMAVPTGSGLGVTLDGAALARYTHDPDV